MTKERRVVLTGMGVLSPLGRDLATTWDNIIACKSGIEKVRPLESDLKGKCGMKHGAYIKTKEESPEYGLDYDQYLTARDLNKIDPFVACSYVAAKQAMLDAGIEKIEEHMADRAGVIVGTGVGGAVSFAQGHYSVLDSEKINPYHAPGGLPSSAAGFLSIKFNLRASNTTVITACASGAYAIGDSCEKIRAGHVDLMLAGGAEYCMTPFCIASFFSMGALANNPDHPSPEASRPWDKERSGFVMAEGAGMVVLEEYEAAKARGANIYAEICGYGTSSDALSLAIPEPNGKGALAAMMNAAKDAQINPGDIDYINAHATSTPVGDKSEAIAVREFMGSNPINISSIKSSIGHTLGAAGAVEAIITVESLRKGILPPTLNLHNPIEEVEGFNTVALEPQEVKPMNYTASNSFGFGGSNACLVFGKI